MPDTVLLVKEKLDIVEFLRGYVQLHPAGKNLKALCPFHKEKTPSFIVSPDRQVWHCFGCNLGGDAISFLMRYENLEFIEALRILAERTGVEMRGSRDEREFGALYDVNRAANEFFTAALTAETAAAKAVREYLRERGLAEETIREFELGFAPNTSDGLSRHLAKAGFKIGDIERAGLTFKTERGTYWDRFRGRIMFPIANHFGKMVGFTGRILPDSTRPELVEGRANVAAESGPALAKYVNSPETPIFTKSKILYGFNKTKNHIREAKAAVLVEGQMDLLMAWQAGVKNVAASSGTSTTAEHLKHLRRVTDTLILAFDTDEAGKAATERISDLAASEDFVVRVMRESANFKDPAEIVAKDPALFPKLVSEAEAAVQFYLRRHLPEGERDAATLKRGARAVLARVKAIASPVEQAYWIRELSRRTGIGENFLTMEMAGVKAATGGEMARAAPGAPPPPAESFPRRDLISQRIFGILSLNHALRESVAPHLAFFDEPYRRLFASIAEGAPVPPDLSKLADLISLRSGLEVGISTNLERELTELIRNLRVEHYRGEQERLGSRIREAETAGDAKGAESALREFDRISKEIYNL